MAPILSSHLVIFFFFNCHSSRPSVKCRCSHLHWRSVSERHYGVIFPIVVMFGSDSDRLRRCSNRQP